MLVVASCKLQGSISIYWGCPMDRANIPISCNFDAFNSKWYKPNTCIFYFIKCETKLRWFVKSWIITYHSKSKLLKIDKAKVQTHPSMINQSPLFSACIQRLLLSQLITFRHLKSLIKIILLLGLPLQSRLFHFNIN